MENVIIIVILTVAVCGGIVSAIKHFKGKGGCCGGGGAYISKKKLNNVIAKKTVVVEGMTCENCVARVTRAINDLDGLSAKVNLKKGEAVVSMSRQAEDDELRSAIESAGYHVVSIT